MPLPYRSLEEIEKLYPNEWVLIDRPTTTRYQQVLGGYVISHSTDKLAVYEEVKKLPKPHNIAVWWTGSFEEEVEESQTGIASHICT